MNDFFEEQKQREIMSAKVELTKCEAMKVLLLNNSIAAEISIAGMTIGICDNTWLLPAVDKQIVELNKFLNEEPNLWQ